MAVKKKVAEKKTLAKSVPAKKTTPAKKTVAPKKAAVAAVPVKTVTKTLYVHYSSFHPYQVVEPAGYTDFYQEGRNAANGILISPILLPVGCVMKNITIYYKNNTEEDLMVLILKHHVQHIAASGEIEVAFGSCAPGTSAPDNFLSQIITLGTNGKILDKYMYHVEIDGTVKNETQERVVLGMKIVYTQPA